MTAPRRLSAGARGSRLRVAIDTARRRGPSEDQLRALRAGLLGAGGAPATPTARPNASGWHVAVAKVAVGVTLAAGGAGLAARAWHRRATQATPAAARTAPAPPRPIVGPSPPPAAASPPPSASPAAASPALSPPPAAGPLHVHRAGTGQAAQRRIASADRPPPPAADGAGELQLIEAAERALPANPELALSLLREHERRYPEGSLQQEREVIAVTALVAVGQRDRARDRADSFARQHPDSTYLPRLRRIISRGDGSRGDRAR